VNVLWSLSVLADTSTPKVATLQLNSDTWWQLLGLVVIAALGSSVVTTIVDRVLSRKYVKRDSASADAKEMLDAIKPLRAIFQATAVSAVVVDDARDQRNNDLTNDFYVAVAKTADDDLMTSAKSYVKIASEFGGQVLTVNSVDEEQEFFRFLAASTKFVKKHR
jgi:hypothetical protein